MKMLVHVDNEDHLMTFEDIWPTGAIYIEIDELMTENLNSFDFNQIWPNLLFQQVSKIHGKKHLSINKKR